MHHVQRTDDCDERPAASDHRAGDRRPHQQRRRRRFVSTERFMHWRRFLRYLTCPHIALGPDFRKILGRSYENLRKFLRLMKILGKTYDNADFRKILRKT